MRTLSECSHPCDEIVLLGELHARPTPFWFGRQSACRSFWVSNGSCCNVRMWSSPRPAPGSDRKHPTLRRTAAFGGLVDRRVDIHQDQDGRSNSVLRGLKGIPHQGHRSPSIKARPPASMTSGQTSSCRRNQFSFSGRDQSSQKSFTCSISRAQGRIRDPEADRLYNSSRRWRRALSVSRRNFGALLTSPAGASSSLVWRSTPAADSRCAGPRARPPAPVPR